MQHYNVNMERSILSTFLFNPEQFYMSANLLVAEDFYLPSHKYIFESMLKLTSQDKPIDEDFIKGDLEKYGRWNEDDMLAILSTNPLPNIESYAFELKQKTQQRYISRLCEAIKTKQSESADVVEILAYVSNKVDEIGDKGFISDDTSIEKIGSKYYQTFYEAQNGKDDSQRYKSGIVALDNIIGAFGLGDLVVICARPSMGKTSFATTVTNYADKQGIGVLFNSMEMNAEKLFRRLHAERSGESINDIKNGVMKNPQRFMNTLKELKESKNIFINDTSYLTIHQLISKAVTIFRKNKHIKYWFVDHLRWIKKDGQNVHEEVSKITKILKKIAKEHGVIIFLLSQLNRDNASRPNKRPMLNDLRESGAVEEDADVVIGLHRESYYNRSDPNTPEQPINEAELIILKNRDGECGIAKTSFIGPTASFSPLVLESAIATNKNSDNMPIKKTLTIPKI